MDTHAQNYNQNQQDIKLHSFNSQSNEKIPRILWSFHYIALGQKPASQNIFYIVVLIRRNIWFKVLV